MTNLKAQCIVHYITAQFDMYFLEEKMSMIYMLTQMMTETYHSIG